MRKNHPSKKYQLIRARYQAKRRTEGWKRRKRKSSYNHSQKILDRERYEAKPYEKHIAPKRMSFIENTDEVLDYFDQAKSLFHRKEKIEFDITDIEELTPDAITLMIANLRDSRFTKLGRYNGTAPKDEKLKKLFMESGFLNFVATSKENKNKGNNMLHKETDYKVRPAIAKQACIVGMEHALHTCEPFEPPYEILVECMQNTNNHASSKGEERCKWWLFVYNDPDSDVSKYSFLDLGVGIFESIIVKSYIKKAFQKVGLLPNTHFVKDLLEGNIHSRIDKDNEIRGKGIPQIVKHSGDKKFSRFEIITNDVQIDLKKKSHRKLKNSFSGTFYYWEIMNN